MMDRLKHLFKVRDALQRLIELDYRTYDNMTELGYVNKEINSIQKELQDAAN